MKNFQRGQSLIELMITIGLVAIMIPALFAGFAATRNGRAQQEQRQKAIQLLQEGQEAVRVAREVDWTNFVTFANANCYDVSHVCHPELDLTGKTWILKASSQTINGFSRNIQISSVSRDASGNIVTTGGTPDSSTVQVTTTVGWTKPNASTVSAIEYLTRNTDLSYTDSPNITLDKSSAIGNWCKPNPNFVAPVPLPGNSKIASSISEAAGYSGGKGHSYTTSGANASGDSMDSVDVTDPAAPAIPSASLGVSYNPSKGNGKAYGIYVDQSTNLAYIALDNSAKATVNVVNATTGASVASYDVGGTGQSVYYSSGYIYVTVGNVLHAINTTTSKDNTITLDGNGVKVAVSQPYAYVATDNTTKQLDIINITDPTKMTKTSVNLGNGAAGVDLAIDSAGANIALVTTKVSPKKDIFAYKITGTGTVTFINSYDSIAMNPSGVALTPDGILIAVGAGGQQYQVFDTTGTNPSCPAGLTDPNGASTVNSVSYLKEPDGDVFAYIITSGGTEGNTRYFQIIAGGPGGGGTYTSPKVFYSSIIPVFSGAYLPHDVAFNSYTASTITNPPTTKISFMFAIHEESGGTCPAGPYPDSDFVAPLTNGQIPLNQTLTYHNPGECLEYKATLTTTDSNQTPTLSSVTINYSP